VATLKNSMFVPFGSALFIGFTATMAERDFSCPCIIGYGSSPSRCGPSLSLDNGESVSRASKGLIYETDDLPLSKGAGGLRDLPIPT
jgi:hypothetical protein